MAERDAPTGTAAARFVRDAAEGFPGLRPILDEHMRDHDEILPHVFFGDVTRWFRGLCATGDPTAVEFADWLDAEYERGHESVQNIIDVSFLENLPWPPDPEAPRVAAPLGPRLRKELRLMQEWEPPPAT